MDPKTTIYLLFREYVDATQMPSCLYIHGRVFDIERLKEEIKAEVDPLFSVLRFFQYEGLAVLYDRKNLDALLFPLKTLPREYPGLQTAVLAQLQGSSSWEENPTDADHLNYTIETGWDVSNDMLGDMARRQHHDVAPCALLHNNAIDTGKDGGVIVNCSDASREVLVSYKDVRGLHGWISENRMPQRHYHYNSKHGDALTPSEYYFDRHGNRKRAAQLLTNDVSTNELLKYAIGKDRDSELWYYDVNNSCFIYFECEGNNPQNGYHAYHLHPGEENFSNIDVDKLRQVQDVLTTLDF